MLTGLFREARFGPFSKLHMHVNFTCGSLSIWTVFRLEILAHINFLFSRKLSRV